MNTQNNQYLDDYVEKYRDTKEKWLKDFNKHHGTVPLIESGNINLKVV